MTTSVSFDVYAKDRASKTFSNVGSSAHASEGSVSKFGSTLKKVASAFLLFEGAKKAGEFLKSSTEAAVADQAAQRKLALALKNTTGANKEQVKGVQEWIKTQSTAYGLSVDDLMPGFQRLAESSGSVTKAQREMKIAMDVSAGTGKSLDTVTAALMKANNGTTASLSRLGLQTKQQVANTAAIQSAQIAAQTAQKTYNDTVTKYGPASTEARIAGEKLKLSQEKLGAAQKTTASQTLTLNQALKKMSDTFHGQAEARAKSLQGTMDRLKSTFHEFEVEVGDKLIPILTNMGQWFLNKGLPALEQFGGYVEQKLQPKLDAFGSFVQQKVIPKVRSLSDWFVDTALPAIKKFDDKIVRNLQPALDALGSALKKDSPEFHKFSGQVAGATPPIAKLAGEVLIFTNAIQGKGVAAVIKFGGMLAKLAMVQTGFVLQFAGGIEKIGQTFSRFSASIAPRIKSAVGNLGHLLYGAGEALIQGLVNGIESKVSGLMSMVGGIAGGIKSKFTGALGIHSPSTVFLGYGANLLEGLVQGIESKRTAVQTVLDKVTAAVQAAGQKLQTAISNRNQFAQGFQGFATSVFGADYGTDANGNPVKPTASSIIAFQKKQAHQAHVVKHDTRKLIQMGLSPALLKQLQSEGSAGMAEIKALASASPAEIARLNRLNKQTSSDLHSAGMSAGNRIYGEQIKQDRQHYADEKKLLGEIRDLLKENHGQVARFEIKGNTLVAILKKEQRTTGNHA